MATQDEIVQAIRNADAAGDSASVRKLGAYLKTMNQASQLEADRQKYNPVNDMSTTEKVLAGAGKAFTDIGRGVGQALGFVSQSDVDEAKKLDAPLMETTSGKVGNVGGNVAIALPTMFVPGAQTLSGAALTGAAMGAVAPVATGESRLQNTVIGGAAGAGGVATGRLLAGAAKGIKAAVEPFTQGGREAIAGRTLQRFGVGAGDVAGATDQATITGARPMLAEQIADPAAATGAAKLQDAVRSLDPEIAGKLAAREAENNAARVGTLKDLAGQDGARDFAGAARSTTSQELYGKAFGSQLVPTATQSAQITKLLQTPAIKDAVAAAKETAANKGLDIAAPEGSVEGLHLMKLAMDDQIAALSNGTASQVNKAMSIKTAQDKLVSLLEDMSPAYKEARLTHAAMSKPLNQMDVAAEILKRGTSATTDLAGNARLMPDALARAARDEGKLITQATGRELPQKTLADLLEPEQLAKMRGVLNESDRAAAVARAANGPGSATADRLASQNILRQMGLPESVAGSTLAQTVLRPVQFGLQAAEPRIQQVLADLVMNPARAQAVLAAAKSGRTLPSEVQAALPYLEQALKTSIPAASVQR